jgi:hypothetical protein
VTLASTALALGSFKSDDPCVAIPMLALSGVAFIALCIWHRGSSVSRALVACVLVGLLAFIGWRDLRKSPSSNKDAGAPPTINQSATDSDCSNLIAGTDAEIKCEAEKERHEKNKKSH